MQRSGMDVNRASTCPDISHGLGLAASEMDRSGYYGDGLALRTNGCACLCPGEGAGGLLALGRWPASEQALHRAPPMPCSTLDCVNAMLDLEHWP